MCLQRHLCLRTFTPECCPHARTPVPAWLLPSDRPQLHIHALRAPVLVQVPARSNLVTGVNVPAWPPVRAYR
eukprot:11302597-Alexandrium_andersonii.AAC.1